MLSNVNVRKAVKDGNGRDNFFDKIVHNLKACECHFHC